MHLSVVRDIAQETPLIPNTPLAYYGLGLIVGAIVCVIAWFVYQAWLRHSAASRGEAGSTGAAAGSAASETSAEEDAEAKKKARKMGLRELAYIAGIYIGTEMIARGLKGIIPGIPIDALVWGVLTGIVLCLMVLIGIQNASRRKGSTGQRA